MIMFGSFLPSLLVGFSTTNSTRAGEPTLSWNQLRSKPLNERYGLIAEITLSNLSSPLTALALTRLTRIAVEEMHLPRAKG